MNMNENKRRRSMLLYILIAIVAYLAISQAIYPNLRATQITSVTYSEFLNMVDNNEVEKVDLNTGDNTLQFTTGEGESEKHYETTMWPYDDTLIQRLDEHGVDVVEARKCRGFPFLSTDLHDGGFIVGMVSHETRLVNAGHAPTYPRFTVTAAGMVSRPTVRVLDASGSAVMDVTMLLDLDAGDVLTLDFEARPTAIELNGANVSHLAKPGSTLAASIGVGEFSIEWSAESGDAAMSVVPSIRERYTGI